MLLEKKAFSICLTLESRITEAQLLTKAAAPILLGNPEESSLFFPTSQIKNCLSIPHRPTINCKKGQHMHRSPSGLGFGRVLPVRFVSKVGSSFPEREEGKDRKKPGRSESLLGSCQLF